MKQLIFSAITCAFLLIIGVCPVYGFEKEAGVAAQLSIIPTPTIKTRDARVEKLQSFLEKNNSPAAPFAKTFIMEADKNNLDWKLVASIAGLESTYCRVIPKYSHNCWGWGIPTGKSSGVQFTDFEDGIATVSEGLRKNYIDRGAVTVEQIGRVYASSPTWANRIHYIMNQLDSYIPQDNNQLIAITL